MTVLATRPTSTVRAQQVAVEPTADAANPDERGGCV